MNSSAEVVVVGGGTVGAWTACLLAEAGHDVLLIEKRTLGDGASSRAAGMVRAQGGTETAIRLGLFTRDFYSGQRERFPLDSGFVEQGYLMPSFTADEVDAARHRVRLQQSLGLDVQWLEADELDAMATGLAPGCALGASFAAGDGYIDPPRNVLAYTAALLALGVHVQERTEFVELLRDGTRATGVRTTAGTISADAVVLTGGPELAAVGRAAGATVHAGGTRHQVVVTAPPPGLDVEAVPMAFDVGSGMYWRPGQDGGLMWGMSNPAERPGPGTSFDADYYRLMRARLEQLLPDLRGVPLRRCWAATIDYTPDHLPILGPLQTADGTVAGAWIASAGGHGMMWGPGVAQATADLVRHGRTDLVDATELGMDRFDAHGRSRLAADPIALPFPQEVA